MLILTTGSIKRMILVDSLDFMCARIKLRLQTSIPLPPNYWIRFQPYEC